MASSSEEGDILPANTPGVAQIDIGMRVVGIDGQPVGRVKEVRGDDFLVDRPMARDVYVPYSFVLAAENPADRIRGGPTQPDQIILTIPAGHVDDQHWVNP